MPTLMLGIAIILTTQAGALTADDIVSQPISSVTSITDQVITGQPGQTSTPQSDSQPTADESAQTTPSQSTTGSSRQSGSTSTASQAATPQVSETGAQSLTTTTATENNGDTSPSAFASNRLSPEMAILLYRVAALMAAIGLTVYAATIVPRNPHGATKHGFIRRRGSLKFKVGQ